MTDVTPGATRGLGRRALLRNGLIVGVGAVAATVAVPTFAGVAEASVTDYAIPPGGGSALAYTAQPNWWWCVLCHALFASDSSGSPNGLCPSNETPGHYGNHYSDAGGVSSWEYQVPYSNAGHPEMQLYWNWCSLCQSLWYSGSNNEGSEGANYCAGNTWEDDQGGWHIGGHNPGTWIYDVFYGGSWVAAGPYLQASWTWCSQCGELFHNGGPDPSNSACPLALGTENHAVGSNWDYQLFTTQAH